MTGQIHEQEDLPIEVILFKTENCAACQAADKIISSTVGELNSGHEVIRLIKYDVETKEGYLEAERRGVESTPAIFVSGKRYQGKVGDEFLEFLKRGAGMLNEYRRM